MKRIALIVTLFAMSCPALAGDYVNGYTRRDGTYVQGHSKTSPDAYRFNNQNSRTNGGTQRDEFNGFATNKRNSAYGMYDNDGDGVQNAYDTKPNKKSEW